MTSPCVYDEFKGAPGSIVDCSVHGAECGDCGSANLPEHFYWCSGPTIALLEMMADLVKRNGGPEDSVPAFLLKHGRYFDGERVKGPRGKAHQCYANAGKIALNGVGYTYVEGYVEVSGVPLNHAFLLDREGRVCDPTIRPGGKTPLRYFGVPFTEDFLRETVTAKEEWGVLDMRRTGIPESAIAEVPNG